MKRKIAIIAMLALFGQALCQSIQVNQQNPGSLWNQTSDSNDLLHDRTACKEGDLLTVIITEATSASFTAQTATSKSDAASISPGVGPVLRAIPGLGVGDSQSSAGAGSTSQAGTFTGTVSCIVKKVFANGTMQIEGTRDIVYNKETEVIKVSGIIRRVDITAANTILSTQIANASIHASGKGQISDRQRQGLLVRLLSWLF